MQYDLTKVHETNLKILKEIDRICRKYKIKYMLDAGTLLGAVRHQGFIPWDDDADVAFTRSNYEAFLKVVKRELPDTMEPVSYTHLDVYKRQVLRSRAFVFGMDLRGTDRGNGVQGQMDAGSAVFEHDHGVCTSDASGGALLPGTVFEPLLLDGPGAVQLPCRGNLRSVRRGDLWKDYRCV